MMQDCREVRTGSAAPDPTIRLIQSRKPYGREPTRRSGNSAYSPSSLPRYESSPDSPERFRHTISGSPGRDDSPGP
jgi:hypothetical protein